MNILTVSGQFFAFLVCHIPYNFKEKIDEKYLKLDEIKKRINSGEDIIGRNEIYKAQKLDSSFPKYILDNISVYKEWITD